MIPVRAFADPGLPTATGLGLGGAQARLARGPGRSCPHPLRYRLRATDKTKSRRWNRKRLPLWHQSTPPQIKQPRTNRNPQPNTFLRVPRRAQPQFVRLLGDNHTPFCSDGRRRRMPRPHEQDSTAGFPERRANRPDARPPESLAETARPASTGSQRRSLCSRATLGGQLALCHDLDRQSQPGRAIAFGQIRVLHGRRLRRCMSAALHR